MSLHPYGSSAFSFLLVYPRKYSCCSIKEQEHLIIIIIKKRRKKKRNRDNNSQIWCLNSRLCLCSKLIYPILSYWVLCLIYALYICLDSKLILAVRYIFKTNFFENLSCPRPIGLQKQTMKEKHTKRTRWFNIYCSYCYIYIHWIALPSREYCLHGDVYRTLISCTVLQILPRFPVMSYYCSISMKLVPWLFLLEAKVLAFRLKSLFWWCGTVISQY